MATKYVATTGSDTTGDGSTGTPWKTIKHGLSQISAGDTLKIKSGTYYEAVTLSKNGVTLEPDTGASVTIDGKYSPALFGDSSYTTWCNTAVPTGLVQGTKQLPSPHKNNGAIGQWPQWVNNPNSKSYIFDPLVYVTANNCIIRNLTVRNSAGRGIHVEGSNNEVAYCTVDFTYNEPLLNQGKSNAPARNTWMHHNVVTRGSCMHFDVSREAKPATPGIGCPETNWTVNFWGTDPGSGSMRQKFAEDPLIEYNVVAFVFSEGITAAEGCKRPTIRYNIIHTTRHVSLYTVGGEDVEIYGNVVYWCGNLMQIFGINGEPNADGIVIGDETEVGGIRNTSGHIYNNLAIGPRRAFMVRGGKWDNYPKEDSAPAYYTILNNFYIGYNTFVTNALSTDRPTVSFEVSQKRPTGSANFQYDNHVDVLFENNLIIHYNAATQPATNNAALPDVLFRNNLWTKTPKAPFASNSDADYATGDPLVVNRTPVITTTEDMYSTAIPDPDNNTFAAAGYHWLDLVQNSRAIGRGAAHTAANGVTPAVTLDRNQNSRTDLNAGAGQYYDIGCHEYGGAQVATVDARFTVDKTTAAVGEAIVFTDTSTATNCTITGRSWAFGDGQSSTAAGPISRSYSAAGTYTPTLGVTTNVAGVTDSYTGPTITIRTVAATDVVASFTQSVNGGTAPLTVNFTDTSVPTNCTITGWDWDWGDGTAHGTTQNPSHNYTTAGTYRVTLTVTTSAVGVTDSRIGAAIVVTDPQDSLTANFTQNSTGGVAPLTVSFTDTSTSTGTVNSWDWDWGDGTTHGTTQNPSHVYTEPGPFTPQLTVGDDNGLFDTLQGSTITVLRATDATANVAYAIGREGTPTVAGDFTISLSLGTNKTMDGAILLLTKATENGVAADDAFLCVGMVDKSGNQACEAIYSLHNQGTTAVGSRRSSSYCLMMIDETGALVSAAQFASATPDGLTLTVPSGLEFDAAYRIRVFAWVGDEGRAAVETLLLGAVNQISTLGASFTPSLLLAAGAFTGDSGNAATDANMSIGAADGTSQAMLMWHDENGLDTSEREALASRTKLLRDWRATSNRGNVVALDTRRAQVQTYDVNDYASFMALLTNAGVTVVPFATPTTTGAVSYPTSALDWDPGACITVLGLTTDLDSMARSDSTAAGLSIGFTVGEETQMVGISSKDNVGTSVCKSYIDSGKIEVYDGDGNVDLSGTISFTTGQVTIDWTTVQSTVKQGFLVLFEAGAEAGDATLPRAYFEALPTRVATNADVVFDTSGTNANGSEITAWLWDFGDGTTSSEEEPTHTYQNAGAYTVSLTVTNAIGSDTYTRAGYIEVIAPKEWLVGPWPPADQTDDSETGLNMATGLLEVANKQTFLRGLMEQSTTDALDGEWRIFQDLANNRLIVKWYAGSTVTTKYINLDAS